MKCTIAIPVYNRKEAVCRALESALAQQVPDLEILVVDDGSTDGAWEAVQGYTDRRIRLVRNTHNLGLFGNFNRCLELATGKYVRILCTDDLLPPGCLQREMALMEAHADVVLLSTRGNFLNAVQQHLRPSGGELAAGLYAGPDIIRAALWVLAYYGHNAFNYPSGVLFRRDVAQTVGGFDAGFSLVGDVDFWLKIALHGTTAIVDWAGCHVTLHENQAGSAVMMSGRYTEEWLLLAQRWSDYLQPPAFSHRIRAQMTAYTLWISLWFLRRRQIAPACLYWKRAMAQHVPAPALCRAVLTMIGLKTVLRLCRVYVRPPMPYVRWHGKEVAAAEQQANVPSASAR